MLRPPSWHIDGRKGRTPMLELKAISKEFPGVRALKDVSVRFSDGEVHALLGENGAGKSTLIKIISGIYQADAGEIFIDKVKVNFHTSLDAMRNKISYVHQEVQVVPGSSVTENIILDQLANFATHGMINWKKANEFAIKYLQMVGLDIAPTRIVEKLTVAQKKLIQIARALSLDANIFLLDEPTTSLTEGESENLYTLIRKLKERGAIVIFVSHKLEEVLKICDRITVLRDGVLVDTIKNSNTQKREIIQMMVGRDVVDEFMGFLDIDYADKVLEAKGFSLKGRFEDISFSLHRGEILGFYGLVGSGRTELAKAILGVYKKDQGSLEINGRPAIIPSMRVALEKYKIGYVSENRKEEGLILSFSLQDNISITIWERIASRFLRLINIRKEKSTCTEMVNVLQIKTTGMNQIVNHLSGGNQQKVSIAKWLAANCDILIIDEPTVGVDVGAKEFIHQLIWNLSKIEKKSIILISSDMPELIKLSRRICVFRGGRIVGEIDELNVEEKNYSNVSAHIGKYLA